MHLDHVSSRNFPKWWVLTSAWQSATRAEGDAKPRRKDAVSDGLEGKSASVVFVSSAPAWILPGRSLWSTWDVLDMVRGWHSSPPMVAWRASTQPLSWSGVGIAPRDPRNV
eukprot:scaffold499_cov335-Pavlova_lutheri.AAC.18